MYIEYEKDDSWDMSIMYQRILKQYMQHNLLVLAIDIDDTVRPFKSSTCSETVEIIKRCQRILNCITIIYTANPNTEQNEKFLKDNDIHYDSINCYPENFPIKQFVDDYNVAKESQGGVLKLYYNILLDDKSCGLENACDILLQLCDTVQRINEEKKKIRKINMEGF